MTMTKPTCIATISTGFEKGDFLVREEQGKRLYFDFFEDAFNYAASRGFVRKNKQEESEWIELLTAINDGVEDKKYNSGKLVMVLTRPAPAKSTPSSSGTKTTTKKKTKQ